MNAHPSFGVEEENAGSVDCQQGDAFLTRVGDRLPCQSGLYAGWGEGRTSEADSKNVGSIRVQETKSQKGHRVLHIGTSEEIASKWR